MLIRVLNKIDKDLTESRDVANQIKDIQSTFSETNNIFCGATSKHTLVILRSLLESNHVSIAMEKRTRDGIHATIGYSVRNSYSSPLKANSNRMQTPPCRRSTAVVCILKTGPIALR
jgi:hypothetical protein